MSESISDELRRRADEFLIGGEIAAIADRIDEEMVELPKGKDGKPIHIRDVVYGSDRAEWRVCEILLRDRTDPEGECSIKAIGEGGIRLGMDPEWLSHERPDSLERIADELEQWCDEINMDGSWRPCSLAKRIRKLANEDGR